MLEFTVLGSGSGGNAFVVRTPCGATVLVDAGLSAKQLAMRLEAVGVAADSLNAIVLTHEHGDHIRGLDVFLRKRKIPVYTNSHTARVVAEGMRSSVDWKLVSTGGEFMIGSWGVECFSVPHDAVDPMGFVFQSGATRVALMTDLGFASSLVISKLQSCHAAIIEANYDDLLLQNDVKRPWSTKQRISSRHGHLSNLQAAELMKAAEAAELEAVVWCHLSGDCNSPEHVDRVVRPITDEMGYGTRLAMTCASQDTPHAWVKVGKVVKPEGVGGGLDAAGQMALF